MSNDNIKAKLKILNMRGSGWLIADLLSLISDDLGIEPDEGEDIGSVVKKYIQELRKKYKKEMVVDSIRSKQIDIETAIIELRMEKLAEICKPIENGTE